MPDGIRDSTKGGYPIEIVPADSTMALISRKRRLRNVADFQAILDKPQLA